MKNSIKSAVVIIMAVLLLNGCGSESAGSYHQEGIEYLNSGSYDKAAASLAAALKKNGERADYYIDYGMALVQLGRYEEAIQNFDRAILDKNNHIVNKNNKNAYRGKGIAYFKSHDYEKAIEQFNKALAVNELSGLNMDILNYKGSSQVKAGLFDKAIQTYTEILQENNTGADTYYSRAYAYRMLKAYDKSLADYDKAIKLDNKNYDYYLGKYFLLLEQGDKEKADAVLSMAANISGTTQEDKFMLAKVHYYMGDYDNAVIEFSEAYKNGFAQAYYFLGSIYEQRKDYKNAVTNYDLYIKQEAYIASAAVYNQMAFCQIKLNNYEEALSYIQKGLKFKDIEFNQSFMQNEIIVYETMGDFEKAGGIMKEYLEAYPDDQEAAKEYEFIKTRQPEVSTPHQE